MVFDLPCPSTLPPNPSPSDNEVKDPVAIVGQCPAGGEPVCMDGDCVEVVLLHQSLCGGMADVTVCILMLSRLCC